MISQKKISRIYAKSLFPCCRHKCRGSRSPVKNTIDNWPRRHSRIWWKRTRNTAGWRRRSPKADLRIHYRPELKEVRVSCLKRGAWTDILYPIFPETSTVISFRSVRKPKCNFVIANIHMQPERNSSSCSSDEQDARVSFLCIFTHFLTFVINM